MLGTLCMGALRLAVLLALKGYLKEQLSGYGLMLVGA